MAGAGFSQTIPKNEHSIIGGRDDKLDDAPLEYYRFHFWINADTAKEHENYVFLGKNAGFICISLMQEKNGQFRVLIRSAMVRIHNCCCFNYIIIILGLEDSYYQNRRIESKL